MFIKKNAQRKPENKQMLSLIAPFKTTCPAYNKTCLNSVAFERSSKVLHWRANSIGNIPFKLSSLNDISLTCFWDSLAADWSGLPS